MHNIKIKICVAANDLLEGTGIFFLTDEYNEFITIDIQEKCEFDIEIYKKIKEILGISIKQNNTGWIPHHLYDLKFDNDTDLCIYYKVILPEKMKVLIGDYKWIHINQISVMEENTRLQAMKAIHIL